MRVKVLGNTKMTVGAIGQGCGGIGGNELRRDDSHDADHIRALRLGIELGMNFLDTAEGYGEGHSEELIGQAIRGFFREDVVIATKFAPEHSNHDSVIRAAEESLRRLQTDYIDLYQIHWSNPTVPLEETVGAMERLVQDGKVRHIGVCNFSILEMNQAAASLSTTRLISNQMEYNLFDRFIETDILPHCRKKGLSILAYSPLDKGRVAEGAKKKVRLQAVADKHNRTIAQVTLNWLVRHPSVLAIPKAVREDHLRDNAAATDFDLEEDDLRTIDEIFVPDPLLVPTDRIRVSTEGDGHRNVYQTLERALANPLRFVPSPSELAEFIRQGEPVKPVRLIECRDDPGRFDYELIEGRIRYWAWVIAHNRSKPIPAYVRER